MREPTVTVASTTWRHQGATDGKRIIPEETAVAFAYDGGTYAVMMATPQNLEDFALGFSFTERLISSPADIRQLDIVEHDAGIELRMWLSEPLAAALSRAAAASGRSDRLRTYAASKVWTRPCGRYPA